MRRLSPQLLANKNHRLNENIMTKKKQQSIHELVPYGLLASRKWLKERGVKRHTLDNWVKSGQLVSIYHGVYTQPHAKITWEGIVCSLQRMGIGLFPGGITVFHLNGDGHFLEMKKQKIVYLYGHSKLPNWVNTVLADIKFVQRDDRKINYNSGYVNHKYKAKHKMVLNNDPLDYGFRTEVPWWGSDDWPLTVSTKERALFEVLLDVPNNISFEYVDTLMQGLVSLSPRRLNKLLEACQSIKVRRLFLWFSERHNHVWLKKIDMDKFSMQNGELGHGKRMLVKGGRLDSKYLITVPEEMK